MADYPPPSFTKGDPGRVQHRRPKGFDRLVADLILAWATFDSGLLMLCVDTFELPWRNGRILFGNMDIKGRLGKLKTLGAHMGFTDFQKLVAQWENDYEKIAVPRNTICHMHYFGHIKEHPERFVFGPSKSERGAPDEVRLLVLHREYFEASRDWARKKSSLISDLLKLLKESPISELEEHLPPIPQESSRKKRGRQPRP